MEYPNLPEIPVYGFAPDLGGLLGLVLAVILPLIAGLLMKQSRPAGTKGTILLLLAAVKVIIEAWLMSNNTGVAFEFVPIVYTTIVNFLIAVAMHFGLWRGTAIQRAAITSGVTDSAR